MARCDRVRVAVVGCMLAGALVLGATGCSSGGASGSQGLPASSDPKLDAGRLVIESKCTMCHTLDRVKSATHDGAGWQATIARMRSNGAVLTDQEVAQVLAYLSSR